jgi:hypothetical protein
MSVSQSKSSLARLLAEENLIVEQRNVSTAYFDGESRLLVLPTLKEDLSIDVTDLMLSHEVGHALFTPSGEWIEVVKEYKVSNGILNVLEDNRIERLIKSKYPGLRVNYSRGYKELMSMDFFGLSEIEIEELNLIDKINLQSKIGFIQGVEFSKEEQVFMDKTEKTKTFDDVVALGRELQDYLKEKFEEEQEKNELQKNEVEQDFGESGDSIESIDDMLVSMGIASVSESKSDSDDDNDDDEDGEMGVLPTIDDYLRSHTDEVSQIRIKALYSDSHKNSIYVDVPDIKLSDYIIDYKKIYKAIDDDVRTKAISKTKYNLFKKDNYDVINYLVKEFLLKKNAEGRKKAKISKTGDINLSKAYAYKITDDIFKRSTIVPKSQSHGLVFFLDWSGSMTDYLEDTVKQMLCMLMFCEKLNIPYEVYAFSSNVGNRFGFKETPIHDKTAMLQPLKLMNLFSSRMTTNEFIKATNVMMSINKYGFVGDEHNDYTPCWFQLGNTPLNHTILISDKVLDEFKERTRINIVNAVYLTDGESHGVRYSKIIDNHTYYGWFQDSGHKTYLRSKKNKVSRYLDFKLNGDEEETNHCVSFIKECCNYRFFGFRLINSRQLRSRVFKYSDNAVDAMKKFNKENCLSKDKTAFDEFYFLRTNVIKESDEYLPILGEKETVANITKKFEKAVSTKVNNRVFLRKFIDFIS